jgi:hypothetical protein
LITRPESFTKRRPRLLWDVLLGVFAVGYLALVLFDDIESPLLSLALILVFTYALLRK